MHKYVDSHLPLGGIYALSPFLLFFLIARKNIAKTWPRSGEKGDQNTILKNHFSHCSKKKRKKKKKKKKKKVSKKERKKERKKEKNRKEKKRKKA